jgi:hypothetical protein
MTIATGLAYEEGRRINISDSNAVIAIVGTAAEGFNLNKPTLIKTSTQAITQFGMPTPGATIPEALACAYEKYGQISFIVVNVAAAAVAAVAPNLRSFDAQDRIQLPHASITGLVVKNASGTTTYVAGTDYTVNNFTGIITRKGTAIPRTDQVLVNYNRPDFVAVTAPNIVGGVNATTGKREGLEALIEAEFLDITNTNISIIITPGYSQLPTVADKLKEIGAKLRAVYCLDAPASATIDEVLAGRNSAAAPVAHFATRDTRAILCYPNPITEKGEQWFSIHVACAMAIAPEWKAPTNNPLRGVIGWKTPLLTSPSDENADNSRLNKAGIVTHLNRNGLDIVIWGHFNGSYPEVAVEKYGLDRIHIIRIIDSVYNQLNQELSRFNGQRLGVNWDGASATIEASVSQKLRNNQNIDGANITWLREDSDLTKRLLAFKLEIRVPDALDIIVTVLEFVI